MTDRSWRRPMVARDPEERHRASTPLELLFDLCFVVAVSQAATQLHHHLAENHVGSGLVGYLTVFFAIWWAWMNFTWFASAYDTDDVPYRLLTLLQIAGVLVLAAGVPSAFETGSFTTITIGYVAMRVAMVAQWLRAASGDPVGRQVCHRYAIGIAVAQIGWVVRLALPRTGHDLTFVVMALVEMAVPVWAERGGRPTTWHPSHITERYGLFTLIVLGECVAAATVAIQSASDQGLSAALLATAGGALLLVFGVWWSYFQRPADDRLQMSTQSFIWGYGHFAIFAAVAALGAGLEVAAGSVHHQGALSTVGAAFAVALPVVVYVVVATALKAALDPTETAKVRYVVVAVALILLAAILAESLTLPGAIIAMGVVLTGLVALDVAVTALAERRLADQPGRAER